MALPLQNAMDSNSWKRGTWVHPNCVEWNTPNCLRGHLLQTYCARQKDNRQLDSAVTRESESSVAKVSLKRRAKDAWKFVKVERWRWEEGSSWTWSDVVRSGHWHRKLPPAWTEHPPVGCLHPAGAVHGGSYTGILLACVGPCGVFYLLMWVSGWLGVAGAHLMLEQPYVPHRKWRNFHFPPMGLLVTRAAWGWFGAHLALCVCGCD